MMFHCGSLVEAQYHIIEVCEGGQAVLHHRLPVHAIRGIIQYTSCKLYSRFPDSINVLLYFFDEHPTIRGLTQSLPVAQFATKTLNTLVFLATLLRPFSFFLLAINIVNRVLILTAFSTPSIAKTCAEQRTVNRAARMDTERL